MTVKDLISKKDYDWIGWRYTLPEDLGGGDMFFGVCKSVDGELISLDGDIYDENTEVLSYEEFTNLDEGIEKGVSVVVEGHFVSPEELGSSVDRMKEEDWYG